MLAEMGKGLVEFGPRAQSPCLVAARGSGEQDSALGVQIGNGFSLEKGWNGGSRFKIGIRAQIPCLVAARGNGEQDSTLGVQIGNGFGLEKG